MWLIYTGASIRCQMQYRVSFVLGAMGQFLATGIDFVGLWALFDRFENLRGWTLPEVALFYGVAHVSFALADMLGSGFDEAGHLIRKGELDRLLLRPRSTILQLLGYRLTLRRMGRMSQGAIVFVWALTQLQVDWSIGTAILLAVTVLCGSCLFLGLLALQATMSIWTVQTLELVNCTTYGGVFAAQHPFSIYGRWFRWLFTFVVPLACVTYFPLVAVLGKEEPLGTPAWVGYAAPVAGPLFLAASLSCWNWGVRRYTSTGS